MPENLTGYLALASACAFLAKICVDLGRMAWSLPQWTPPTAALVLAILFAFLLQVAGGTTITQQLAAQCVIVGVLAAGGAVGATELQKRAA